MPPVSFTAEVKIDGESYRCRPLSGPQTYAIHFVPQVMTQHAGAQAYSAQIPGAQLEPLNEEDWSDGRG